MEELWGVLLPADVEMPAPVRTTMRRAFLSLTRLAAACSEQSSSVEGDDLSWPMARVWKGYRCQRQQADGRGKLWKVFAVGTPRD